jgi:uncharacterized alpha-E superfamily protein
MARYLERAENTARLLDAGFRMALTRGESAAHDEWQSVLITIGQDASFSKQGCAPTGPEVTNFILRAPDNPGSVLQMIEHARTNARAVRTALTREVWEATNECWMVLRETLSRPACESNLGDTLATIRRHAMLVRGAMDGTMLHNDILNFARLGTYIERADNTARILDVKYYLLLPSLAWVGSSLDSTQWETVLRSLAGERAYRWLNAGAIDPRGIAQFILLDPRFPRSLAYCYDQLGRNLEDLAREYGAPVPAHDLWQAVSMRLRQANIDEVFEQGLHSFILDFIGTNQRLADVVSCDFRFVA